MIMCKEQTMEEMIAAALGAVAGDGLCRERYGRWRLVGGEDRKMNFVASLDGAWLDLRVGGMTSRSAWELLGVNGALAGTSKCVLTSQGGVEVANQLWLEWESLLTDDDSPKDRISGEIARAMEGLGEACDSLGKVPIALQTPQGDSLIDLADLCGRADWAFNSRAQGRVAVQLEVAGSYIQAMLEKGERGVRVVVELPVGDGPLSAASREAAGMVLLRAGAVVRWVRPALIWEEGRELLRYEVPLGEKPAAAALDQALAALSVACRMSYREVMVLAGDEAAKKFLSIRGCSSA